MVNWNKTLAALTVVSLVFLGGCSGMSHQEKDTAVGAGVGAAAGAVITGGSAVGTGVGAVLGGVIGNEAGKK
jgi:osmotically inducible lipoprotein OsmB